MATFAAMTVEAALARAATLLTWDISPRSQPSIAMRIRAKLRQPFTALFGARQKRTNQALYDAVRDLAARHRELEAAVESLRAITEPMHCRPRTLDAAIWHEVGVANEYHLPDYIKPNDAIIDIGTHIGSFSMACLIRGAGRVYSFEVEAGNHAAAAMNLSRFGKRSVLHRAAVWRSDGFHGPVYFSPSADGENTGGGTVLNQTGEPVKTISLDAVIDEALRENNLQKIRLLKLDCEGSEYPILLTCTRLDAVEEIYGEYHEPIPVNDATRVGNRSKYDRWVIQECLERAGFKVALQPNPKNANVGLFFAKR